MTTVTNVVRISPAEAHAKMMHEGYTYLDVRTPEEVLSGRPEGSINIAWSNDEEAFLSAVEAKVGGAKDAKIIIGCKSGVRSLHAARALIDAGYTNIVEQRAGYDAARGTFGEVTEPGWSRAGLPCEMD